MPDGGVQESAGEVVLLGRRTWCSLAAALAALLIAVPVNGADEEHFLEYTEYNYAVNFISGNLTATVTPATVAPRDWPRIVFEHNSDMLSPTFDVGMSTIYLFNDTNGDGVFAPSEATYLAPLSSFYNVTWSATAVAFGNDTVSWEYAWLSASADIALFKDADDIYPMIDRWANVTFQFTIAQKTAIRANSYGNYVVQGMVDVRVNFSLTVLEYVEAAGLVVEHELREGGLAELFLVREDVGQATPLLTVVQSGVDETLNGDNFTHPLRETLLPCQDILFAMENQTVLAHYRISSEPYARSDTGISQVPMGISYYTNPKELVVHTSYFPEDMNQTLTHEIVVGIDEAGFTPGLRDWLKENWPVVLVFSGSVVAVVSIVVLIILARKHYGWGVKKSAESPPEKKP
jgi:hypothetical protein